MEKEMDRKLENPITRIEQKGDNSTAYVLGNITGTNKLYMAHHILGNGNYKPTLEIVFKESYNINPLRKRTEQTLESIELTKYYNKLAGKIEKENIEDMDEHEREVLFRKGIINFANVWDV